VFYFFLLKVKSENRASSGRDFSLKVEEEKAKSAMSAFLQKHLQESIDQKMDQKYLTFKKLFD
jgi:hypothetical protein